MNKGKPAALSSVPGNIGDLVKVHQTTKIDALDLSRRAYNCLQRAGITTVEQVAALSDDELLEIRNVGLMVLNEIKTKLAKYKPIQKMPEEYVAAEITQEKHIRLSSKSEKLSSNDLTESHQMTPIEVLRLSPGAYNCLQRADITTVEQVAALSDDELLQIRHLGPVKLNEIWAKLADYKSVPETSKKPTDSKGTQANFITPPSKTEVESNTDLKIDTSTLADHVNRWLAVLTRRERQVISWRYGLDNKLLTLQQAGEKLSITRERVRQIQSRALRKLKKPFNHSKIQTVETYSARLFEQTGGILDETQLVTMLEKEFEIGEINPVGVMQLVFECREDITWLKQSQVWVAGDDIADEVINVQTHIFELVKQQLMPVPINNLLNLFKQSECYKSREGTLSDEFILACLHSHAVLVEDEEGNIGLEKWERKWTYRIIQALRELGKPAHYSEIAKAINTGLPIEQHITPRAVHIRLMQHPEFFVWVRLRGTYGLKEWGLEQALSYEDALAQILQEAGHPLTFQQILAELPKFRPYYEESSIVLTLGTNERFQLFPDETYGLAKWHKDKVITEDYRLKRLFKGAEVISSPRPKPKLTETLNSVDSFITQARERLSDNIDARTPQLDEWRINI